MSAGTEGPNKRLRKADEAAAGGMCGVVWCGDEGGREEVRREAEGAGVGWGGLQERSQISVASYANNRAGVCMEWGVLGGLLACD